MSKVVTAGVALAVLLLGLPLAAAVVASMSAQGSDCAARQVGCGSDTASSITLGTLNLLGAGHTDGNLGRGGEKPSFPPWDQRLPGALKALEDAGVTIAGLQEVHPPQARALTQHYATAWGIYPAHGPAQNRVLWDRDEWQLADARLVPIPYFGGRDVGMPLVRLSSIDGRQAIWIWSVHNPASTRGNATALRAEALRRELETLTEVAVAGEPTVILGDFNDGRDGRTSSQCVLTPAVANAFGGSSTGCTPPGRDAPIDHIYGANLTWATARVERDTQTNRISDHPLVLASTVGSSGGRCAPASGDYSLGPVTPQLTRLVGLLAPRFGIDAVGGWRSSATDPDGHPAGLAADFMISSPAQGDRLAAYARSHAQELGIDYVIWWQRIWSVARASEGWRPMADRGGVTENHRDHVHISVRPDAAAQSMADDGASCDDYAFPVPTTYAGTDNHNWHAGGSRWDSWHTGTDFSVPCGTPVYAAHAGTIEIDTTQAWAGPRLVRVARGPGELTTWYAHMEAVVVSRGQTVRAGQQVGMVGREGNASGCHLHFEVHLEGGPIYGPDNVNPSTWLAEHVSRSTGSR